MTDVQDIEPTPCGRGEDSYACGGCDCGLEARQVRRLRADLAEARADVQRGYDWQRGYADSLNECQNELARTRALLEQYRAALVDALGDGCEDSPRDVCEDYAETEHKAEREPRLRGLSQPRQMPLDQGELG